MVEIKLNFDDIATRKLGLLDVNLAQNLNSAVKDAAFIIEATAKKKISHGSRTGRVYRLYRGGQRPIIHKASAPGEPPKTDTGRLVNSIRTNFYALRAEIGSDVKYSAFLETGTSKMQPRPWLESSLDENSSKVKALFDNAIKESLK